MRARRLLLLIVSVLLAALALGACGSDDPEHRSRPTTRRLRPDDGDPLGAVRGGASR